MGQASDLDLLGLVHHAHEALGGDEPQGRRVLTRRDPQHRALGAGLETEPVHDALGEGLERERREESHGALVERELAHVVEVLLHEPVVLELEAPAREEALERVLERAALDGLQQVVGGALLHAVDGGLHAAHAGQHDDGDLGVTVGERAHEVRALHVGQHHVGQHDVEDLALEGVLGLGGRRRGAHVVAVLAQQLLDEAAEVRLIVDCQDPTARQRSPLPGRAGLAYPVASRGRRVTW